MSLSDLQNYYKKIHSTYKRDNPEVLEDLTNEIKSVIFMEKKVYATFGDNYSEDKWKIDLEIIANLKGLNGRHKAIILKFKVESGIIQSESLTRKELMKMGGKNLEIHYDCIKEKDYTRNKKRKEITDKEIEFILPYLEEFPPAYDLAKKYLNKLQ
jgi:hypothetical protein